MHISETWQQFCWAKKINFTQSLYILNWDHLRKMAIEFIKSRFTFGPLTGLLLACHSTYDSLTKCQNTNCQIITLSKYICQTTKCQYIKCQTLKIVKSIKNKTKNVSILFCCSPPKNFPNWFSFSIFQGSNISSSWFMYNFNSVFIL